MKRFIEITLLVLTFYALSITRQHAYKDCWTPTTQRCGTPQPQRCGTPQPPKFVRPPYRTLPITIKDPIKTEIETEFVDSETFQELPSSNESIIEDVTEVINEEESTIDDDQK
jgi:hypothetical protein